MSGHSKWSTIKRKKGAADAKRGIVFTQLSKEITLSAKEGGGDPDLNPSLRLSIKKAKNANMPTANIEKAINKGIGNLPGIIYESFVYEGYGPGGVAILMEVMTDNKNRTVPEIRTIMSKFGGNLGESGCVNWMFDRKGIININKSEIIEDEIFSLVIDLGAEEFINEDNDYIVICSPESFGRIIEKLEKQGVEIEGEITLNPNNSIKIFGKNASRLLELLETLELHDDIQKVFSNFELDDSELNKII